MRLIDADALYKGCEEDLQYRFDGKRHFEATIRSVLRYLEQRIAQAPTIEAEPVKRGRWVDVYGDPVGMVNGVPQSDCWCEKCRAYLTGSGEYSPKGYYCPNCGAKMDKEASNGFDNSRP